MHKMTNEIARKAILVLCMGALSTAPPVRGKQGTKPSRRMRRRNAGNHEHSGTTYLRTSWRRPSASSFFRLFSKAAFVVGASYGRGAMVCRTGKDFRGPWGAPAMYALEGGSVAFQIGGQATDLVLLVMNDRGASSILTTQVKLGADATVAAGPVGRDASADTDAYMRAEILSYSTHARSVLRGFRSRAPRFVPTTTPRRTYMAAN